MTNSLSQSAQVIHLASQQLWYASILSILSHLASPADRQVICAGMNWSIDVLLYPVIDCILVVVHSHLAHIQSSEAKNIPFTPHRCMRRV